MTAEVEREGTRGDGPTERRILVVDDSVADRAAIRRLLAKQRRPYTVEEAATGREGLALLRSAAWDCVLLDYYLPDMEGDAFLAALDGDGRQGPPVPVAILSGRESDDNAAAGLARGAQDYLVKEGLTAPTLVRAIENAVEKFRIQRELVQSRIAVELRNHKLEVMRDQLQDKVAELAEATKTKDKFMAVMSHEMRTPLNAIIGYADLLQLEVEGQLTRGQRRQIARILVASRHLLDLINDVLDLARADADKLVVDLVPLDPLAVVEEVAALLESQAGEKGIALEVDAGNGVVPPVRADLRRLRQIVTNLVGNAIKFTEEGRITVRCRAAEDGGDVLVEVEDTGIGIDPDVLPLVFSEFYQAEGDLTREQGGSGLGLAISQRLATLMGGQVEAESTLGKGSTFRLRLPAAGEPPAASSEGKDEEGDRPWEGGDARGDREAEAEPPRPPVAVVAFGDRPEALAELERRVRPGVQLAWTTDAAEVAELAVRTNAPLVVLDGGSASGAAWEAATALQEVQDLARTAILLLPSLPALSKDEDTGGLDLGWVSLVPKPFTAAQLTHAVSTAARGHEARGGEGGAGPASYQVLVVDDDPDSRQVAAKFLAETDVHVREAPDGETALAAMRDDPPDVIVLDLMMPVLDGFGVLAAMRADPALASIPVVVLTAKSLTQAERAFLARTTVRVLQKGEHRLADVATLVLRAAARTRRG